MHSESRRKNANTLKFLKVDSSPAVQRKFIVKAEAVGAGHVEIKFLWAVFWRIYI
jgi:hypothetical protein